MDRQISRLVATCKTIEVARVGAAAAVMRHGGADIPYAFTADEMLLDQPTSESLIGDPSIETGGWLARAEDGSRIPTMSAVLGADRLRLDMARAGVLLAVLEAPLRVAHLAGKMAVAAMPETGEVPVGFLDEDEDGAYPEAVRRAAGALLRVAAQTRDPGLGAQVMLMARSAPRAV